MVLAMWKLGRLKFMHSFTHLFIHSLCGRNISLSINFVLLFFYNNKITVGHMVAKIPYIYQLPLQLGVAMWNVRSDVCHLQLWDFRHLDMHL